MLPGTTGPSGARVLLVAPQPLYEDRGTPIALRLVLKALSELGSEVDVLTYPVGVDVPLPGVSWFRCSNPLGFRTVPVGLSFRKVILDIPLAIQFTRMVRANRYHFVHAVEEAGFLGAWLCGRAGIPLLYDMQSSIPQQLSRHPLFGTGLSQRFLRRCERWLLSRADLVVASAGLGDYVREKAPSAQVEEWRYPAAIRPPPTSEVAHLKEALGLPENAKVVVYSGTFEEYQGLPALVEAAREVLRVESDTVFIAVGGDPKSTARLEAQTQAMGLGGRFRVIERQPRDRALGFIELADVVVSPRAHGDNLPLKIADYMAAAKPIVATRIPAHTAVLDSSRAILTGTDGESLARGILSVLEDNERAARLSEAARLYGEEHLAWPAFVRSISDYSHRLTPRAASRPPAR